MNLRRLLGLGRSREFDLSKAFNDLGIRLLRDENPEKNCFLSPLSIGLALSMLPAGARGRTRRELENLLGVPNGACELGPLVEERIARLSAPRESKGRAVKFALHMANALFVRRGYRLREDYVERLRRHWDSECRPVDFEKAEEAAARINDWVAEQTNDLIKELVSSDDLDVETRLVLVNAIYFQGEWLFPFDDFLTESEPFFGSVHRDRAIVKAAIMKKTHEYPYYTDEHLDALELPFDSMSMLVLAPKRGSLAKLEEWVSTDEIWKTADMMRERRLELRIPRFSMEASFSMGRRLQDYGLRLAFSEKADFSGITDDPAGLMISKVLHRARIELNEKGVKAATATAVVPKPAGRPTPRPDPIPVSLDHPFLFFVIDRETRLILFAGRMAQPEPWKGEPGRERLRKSPGGFRFESD